MIYLEVFSILKGYPRLLAVSLIQLVQNEGCCVNRAVFVRSQARTGFHELLGEDATEFLT